MLGNIGAGESIRCMKDIKESVAHTHTHWESFIGLGYSN